MNAPFSLAATELFAGLDDRDAAKLAATARVCTYRRGVVVFDVGDVAESVFVVREGRIDVTVPLRVLGEPSQVTLETHLPGSTLGWAALAAPHRFTTRAVASTGAVLLGFARERLLPVIGAEPRIGVVLGANVAHALANQVIEMQALWMRAVQRDLDDLAPAVTRGAVGKGTR